MIGAISTVSFNGCQMLGIGLQSAIRLNNRVYSGKAITNGFKWLKLVIRTSQSSVEEELGTNWTECKPDLNGLNQDYNFGIMGQGKKAKWDWGGRRNLFWECMTRMES